MVFIGRNPGKFFLTSGLFQVNVVSHVLATTGVNETDGQGAIFEVANAFGSLTARIDRGHKYAIGRTVRCHVRIAENIANRLKVSTAVTQLLNAPKQ